MWLGLLAAANACGDRATCAEALRQAAARAAVARVERDDDVLVGHLVQAYARFLQVQGREEDLPERFATVCRALHLPDCPARPRGADLLSALGQARQVPFVPFDAEPTVPFTYGREIGGIHADGKRLRWGVMSGAVDVAYELETEVCDRPRAVADELWVPRRDARKRCRVLEVLELEGGASRRTVTLPADFGGFPLVVHEAPAYAILGGELGVLAADGSWAWRGPTVPEVFSVVDAASDAQAPSGPSWVSFGRQEPRVLVVSQDGRTILTGEGMESWSHDQPCVLASDQLICIASDRASVWSAVPDSPDQRQELRTFAEPTRATHLVAHGGGCVVELARDDGRRALRSIGGPGWIVVDACEDRSARMRFPRQTGSDARPVLTDEELSGHTYYLFDSVLQDGTVSVEKARRLTSLVPLQRVEQPVSVVAWPEDGEQVFVGVARPQGRIVELLGRWEDVRTEPITVQAAGVGIGGVPVEYLNPWTRQIEAGVTDLRGSLQVPAVGEPSVRLARHEDELQRTATLTLPGPARIEPVAPVGAWQDEAWRGSRDDPWFRGFGEYRELVEGLWTVSDERITRIVAFADPAHAVVFTLMRRTLVPGAPPTVFEHVPGGAGLPPGRWPIASPQVPGIPLLRAKRAVSLDRDRFLRRREDSCLPSWAVVTLTPDGRWVPEGRTFTGPIATSSSGLDRDLYGELLEVAETAKQAEMAPPCEGASTAPFQGDLLLRVHPQTPLAVLQSVVNTAGQAQFGRFWLQVARARKVVPEATAVGEPLPFPTGEADAEALLEQLVSASTWRLLEVEQGGAALEAQGAPPAMTTLESPVFAVPIVRFGQPDPP